MSKTLIVFPSRLGVDVMAKSHVAGYTRKDGVFVKEHDDKRMAKPTVSPTSSHKMERFATNWDEETRYWGGDKQAAFAFGWHHANDKHKSGHVGEEPTKAHLGSLSDHYKAGKDAALKKIKETGDADSGQFDAYDDHIRSYKPKSTPSNSGRTAAKSGKAAAAKPSSGATPATKTENEGWGFHGGASESYLREKHGPDFDHSNASSKDIGDARSHADKKFQGAADHLVQANHFDNHEQARDFLDSRYGRHSHDELGPDGDISKNRWLSHYVKLHKKEAGMSSTAKTGSKKPS